MANYITIAIIVGIVCGQALSVEDVDRNLLGLNLPYGRGLVSSNSVEIIVEKYLKLD